jgi:precorrin-2 dehydrogenase / sirohydrochlorin ferrochelatase
MTRYYPAYLNLTDKRCVVIGAGVVAERKVTQLLASDANVTLVSPTATSEIERLTSEGKVEWHKRSYQQGDLAGATLAIAATDDESVNRAVHAEAQRENTLLNVVDVTPLCGFIAPSIVERGSVTVAISTGGGSPALARKLRELMNGDQNPDHLDQSGHPEAHDGAYCRCLQWADAAGVLSEARAEVRAQGTSATPETWQAAMTVELLELVQAGKTDEAKDRLLDALLATAR